MVNKKIKNESVTSNIKFIQINLHLQIGLLLQQKIIKIESANIFIRFIYSQIQMNNQFRDRFQEYLSRRLNPQQAQNIVFSSQKTNLMEEMDYLSPHPSKYNNFRSSQNEQSERSIDSSAFGFSQSRQTSRKSNCSHPQTTSMKKGKLRKVKEIQENVCSICLQPYKNRVQMSCGHSYCSQCLQQWLKTSSRCPYCRSDCPYYICRGKKYQIQQKEYQYQPPMEIEDDGLDYECYMCEQTNQGDQVLICDRCQLYACHIRCDPRLRGRVPGEDEQWFCHFC